MIKFFSASWCGPCNALKNMLTEEDLEGVEQVDVDHQPAEVSRYGIKSVPTLVRIDEAGDPIDSKVGSMSRKDFLEFKNE